MMDIKSTTAELLDRVRKRVPLIHNITNFVVMNSSANILLAIGASPVMAHGLEEVEEMTSLADALVLNIGTIQKDWLEPMIRAAQTANAKGIPVVLDPVGAGATRMRTEAVNNIMNQSAVAVLRGNASEILSLGTVAVKTRGVDASEAMSDAVVNFAAQMARDRGCVVAISGPQDCITDGQRLFRVENGQPIMARVTGTGCGLTAVTAAFCAVADGALVEAVTAAFAFYGLCGDLAAKTGTGPGSFSAAFIDRLFSTGSEQVHAALRVKEVR